MVVTRPHSTAPCNEPSLAKFRQSYALKLLEGKVLNQRLAASEGFQKQYLQMLQTMGNQAHNHLADVPLQKGPQREHQDVSELIVHWHRHSHRQAHLDWQEHPMFLRRLSY